MKYESVAQAASVWNVSERSVRNYCAEGRVPGAVLDGKTWRIPDGVGKPERKQRAGKVPEDLLERLRMEKDAGLRGGIYHRIQIEFAYNSNHIEGSRLTHEQTRCIYETNTIGLDGEPASVDDIVETVNHFRCVDMVIDMANYSLSESLIKQLHRVLKSGTSDSRRPWFAVGEYKRLGNEVGGNDTASPAEVPKMMGELLAQYNSTRERSLEELVDFHFRFERIHPFQDGNGRIGRLILFKECLRNGIVPFVIEDDMKEFYYRGLANWECQRGWLMDTCLAAQDRFREVMAGFGIGRRN